MVHTTCSALHCLSSSHTNKDLKFHQFPHDAERRKIWITACQRTDVIDKDWDFFKHKYVCSLHFQKCMYGKKDHLKKSAIPSLHLSEKPLQHDSSTQTVKSIQYVNQRSENDASISYAMPNVESNSATTHTQAEDSLPYDINQGNVKEGIITHTKIEESESVEQDVEIKTENDDKNCDSGSRVPILFEEDVEMKTETDGNEILPLVQSIQSLRSDDLKIIKDGGTLRSDGSVKAGVAECVEGTAAECGGVVVPDVVVASNLSEKPLQHGSSTQTVKSIQYVNQRSKNDVSISYVIPNVESNSATTHTQAEDSLPYDINQVNIKEGIITRTKIEETESFEQDVEIKTENDDKNSDSGSRVPILFEEDVEMKTETVGTEILPLVQFKQSLRSDNRKIRKDGGTLSSDGSVKSLVAECVEGTAVKCGEVVAPDVAGTLSKKLLKNDSFTQTVESIQYVNQQSENDVSIMYVMPNVEKSPTTTYTQTEDSLPYDINHDIKEKIITRTKIEESESVEQDVEIKTENDDNLNSDSGAFEEEDLEMKIEIVENEILPLVQSTQSLQSDNLEIKKGSGTLSTQARNLVQEINQGLTAAIVNKTSNNPLNTTMMPILKRKMDGSIQTDRVIVLSCNADGSARSINPEECMCNRNDYIDMTRLQFYRVCSKFLSGNFAINVRRQMHLDDVIKQGGNKLCEAGSSRSVKAGTADCVELKAAGCGGVVQPDVVSAGTATADSAEAGLYVVDRVEASAAASATVCARRLIIHNVEDMPVGLGPESPLHPSRKRRWQPSASPRPSLPPPQMEVVVERVVLKSDLPPPSPPPLSPAFSVPSPASYVDYLESAPSPAMESLRDEDIFEQLCYGSEADSGESDDEELSPFIFPRAQRSALETPMDADDDAEPDPAPAPAAAAAPAAYETASTSINSILDVPPTATDQPWSLYDFDWKPFPDAPIPHESRREKFSHIDVGPTAPCVDPYDIFVAIWDQQFMEYIASETNRYAQQLAAKMLETNNLHPNSRINKWRDTTADEIYVYFGIVIAMGVVVKSRVEEYWNATTDVFYTPGFSAHMSGHRFSLLSKCLHFANNGDMCALKLDGSEAKLFKVQPVLSHLNNKFSSMYRLRQNIALDESLLQWKGWLDISQLISNKAAAKGIKTYEICESQTGYLWRFEVHAHKKSQSSPPQQFEDPLNASTPAIVLRLTHGLEGKGHTLWMDNFYNSPCLARRLKSLGFDCVGTLRTDRKFVPQALHSLTKQNMRPGQLSGLTSGDVDVMVWRDNNRVSMISTYHGNAVTQIRDATKPILIHDYNIMMGGVDKKDLMLAKYPIERKRTKVWYKKLFRRLLNVSILNSYIIHRQSFASFSSSFPLSHRNFRIALVKSLLSKHCSRTLQPATSQPATSQILHQNKQIDVTHRVAEYPFGNCNKRQRRRRKCVKCSKLVQTFCVGCSQTVCIDPCFLLHHS